MTARPLVLTLILPTALALAACGSGTKRMSAAQYRARLAVLSRQENANHAHVDNLPQAKSVAVIRSGLSAFAAGEQRMGDEVAALKPPKDAVKANALLARGAHDDATEIGAVLAKMKSAKTPRQAFAVISSVGGQTHGGKETDTALAELKKLGYTHGS
jgi:hypothetical protein